MDEHLNDEHDDYDEHNGLVKTIHDKDPPNPNPNCQFFCGFF